MSFAGRLDEAVERSGSLLCLGLDPADATSAAELERSCNRLLEATLDLVCAVKPNIAFFERLGSAGYAVLERLRARIPREVVLIVDAKRGDIGSTAQAYAEAVFDVLGADAVTVNPLQGRDAVQPFLSRPDRGAFLLTRTSNPGAADLLDQRMHDERTLFDHIVELGRAWDPGGAVGFVVGATNPVAVAAVRAAAPDAPLLLPGVGAQGGPLVESVAAAIDARRRGVVVAVSRGIAAAAEGPRDAAITLRRRIDDARSAVARA